MKKIILLFAVSFLCACSNSPVDSPGGNQDTETLLIDRTGITDSIHTGNDLIFLRQYFEFSYSEMRVTFDMKGNPVNSQNWLVFQKRNDTTFFKHLETSLTNSYKPIDTSFHLSPFTDTLQARINCNVSSSWLAIRDLKIYGK